MANAKRPARRLTRRRVLLGGAGAVAGGAVYAFGIEPVWLRAVEIDVPVRALPPELDGFTIAQLSDLHVGAGVPRGHLEDAVALANSYDPDLVALTGDFVHQGVADGHAGEAAAILAGLRARHGAIAVLGNHDAGVYGVGDRPDTRSMDAVAGALRDAGIRVLENESVPVGGIAVHGSGDLWSGRFDAAAVVRTDRPLVVLSHNPDTAPALAARGPDVILAGHTHGGQVRVPFLGPPILPVRHREFAAGPYRLGDTFLYVNRGVGWLRRVRLFVRPEVTVLRLKRAGFVDGT